MNGSLATGPVLHPTDFSEAAAAAHPYALYLAALFGADLHLLHVEESGSRSEPVADFPDSAPAWSEASSWLAGSEATRPSSPEEVESPAIRRNTRRGGGPAEVILACADDIGAGAISMGTRGRGGIRRLVLGSVTERVVRKARRPVMTVRQGARGWEEDGLRRLLVGADLSPMMQPALAWAGTIAAASRAELMAVHVVTSYAAATEQEQLQRIHAAFRELDLDGVDLNAELMIGDPGIRIRELADEHGVDLIVTSTHGRSVPARLVLGSTTEHLVRRAPCPVLTVSDPPPRRGT